jgi:HEPN domain-containing protein
MNANEALERRREAARWLVIAREDARVARACLLMEPQAVGVAAYHCHQSAEKLLKGLLIVAGIEFRMTHDLDRLASLAQPHYPQSQDLVTMLHPLSSWGIAYRYPGPEAVPEPLPNGTEIEGALNILDALAARLRGLTVG